MGRSGRLLDEAEAYTAGEHAISGMIRQWASESGDGNPLSVLLQACANEEFAAEMATSPLMKHFSADAAELLAAARKTGADKGIRRFLREMYNETQAWLAETGEEYVTLYRGAAWRDIKPGGGYSFNEFGGELASEMGAMEFQPLSSFSTALEEAVAFSLEGDYVSVVAVRVPKSRIAGTCRTGFGCKDEAEMVVLGGVDDCRAVTYHYDIETMQRGQPPPSLAEIADALGGG